MESCDACSILFPSKKWLDKHKLTPQHAQMQQFRDTDHNYAKPPPFFSSVGNASGRTISSCSVSVIQRNPNFSGERRGSVVPRRAPEVPQNRQRTTGDRIIERPAAPGDPKMRSVQQKSATTTARTPARDIRRMIDQRKERVTNTLRKPFPKGRATVPQGNHRIRGTLKQAPGKQPCPDITQNLRKMRSNITMQIKQSADHKLSFDQVNKDAFCSVVSKQACKTKLERQHESYRVRDFLLPSPKKLVLAAAGWGGGLVKLPAQKKSLSSSSRFNPFQPSSIRGNGLHDSSKKSFPGKAGPSTSSAMKTSIESRACSSTTAFSAGRGERAIKVAAMQSTMARKSGGNSVLRKTSLKPVKGLNPNHPPPKNVEEDQSSSNQKSTKLATKTEGALTSTSSATTNDSKSAESVAIREADHVVVDPVSLSPFKTREYESLSQDLGSNPTYSLNTMQPCMKNVEEEQTSSNGNSTTLAPDTVVTSSTSAMETSSKSTSEVGRGVDMVSSAVESAPPITTIEAEGKAPSQQNCSNQPTCGEREVAEAAVAQKPYKTRGVRVRTPAQRNKRNLVERFNPTQTSIEREKVVPHSPNMKSIEGNPGSAVPWLSAAGRGNEDVATNSTATATAPNRPTPPKLAKVRKGVRRINPKQLKDYVPTMPGTDYKMPALTSIGSFTNEEGKQMWICLVCCQIEPMISSMPMVCCETCNDWYHFKCVGIKKKIPTKDPWYCKRCIHRSSVCEKNLKNLYE